jgi:hypothetical protein
MMKLFSKYVFIFQMLTAIIFSQENNFVGYNCYGSSGGFLLPTPEVLSVGNVSLSATYLDYFSVIGIKNGLYKNFAFGITQNSEAYLSFLSLSKNDYDENNSIGGLKYNVIDIQKQLGFAASTEIRMYQFENIDTAQDNKNNGYFILPSFLISSERIGNYYFYGMIGYKLHVKENNPFKENVFLGLGMTISVAENLLCIGEITHNEYSLRSSGLKSMVGVKWNMFENIQLAGGMQLLYERSQSSMGIFVSLSFSTSVFSSMKTVERGDNSYFIPPPIPEMKTISDVDSDDDGLTDDEEKNKYKTDPNIADTDGDKLSDGLEVFRYKTDPLNNDTDGDGVTDGDEVLLYKTNPLSKDTDFDSLSDGDEILQYHTDPFVVDTDSGGVTDGDEVLFGTDPLNRHDDEINYQYPLQKYSVIGIIHYDNNITPSTELKKILGALKRDKNMVIDISIYDPLLKKNNTLERIDIVRNIFLREQINSNRFTIKMFDKHYGAENNNGDHLHDVIMVIFRRK